MLSSYAVISSLRQHLSKSHIDIDVICCAAPAVKYVYTWRTALGPPTERNTWCARLFVAPLGPRCFVNGTINAKVPSCPLLYGDAGWHICSICTLLMTPCGCNHLISVFHLVKWSFAEWFSTQSERYETLCKRDENQKDVTQGWSF